MKGQPLYSEWGLRYSTRRGTACRAQRVAVLRLPPVRPLFPLGARPPAAAERGPGWGKKSAVLTADASFPDSIYSLGGVFFALGHDFRTGNPASRTLSTTPAKPCHRLFTSFLLTISTT